MSQTRLNDVNVLDNFCSAYFVKRWLSQAISQWNFIKWINATTKKIFISYGLMRVTVFGNMPHTKGSEDFYDSIKFFPSDAVE